MISSKNERVQIEKWVSLVLRHRPQKANLDIDSAGWAQVSDLLKALQQRFPAVTLFDLEQIVQYSRKKRFMLSEDGERIRANQGHSVDVDLGLEAQVPPPRLYHGTAQKFVESIMNEGLKKGSRHAVHLSLEMTTATQVGQRRGRPVILSIDSARMHQDGFIFFCSANGVWLTEYVPAKYLSKE